MNIGDFFKILKTGNAEKVARAVKSEYLRPMDLIKDPAIREEFYRGVGQANLLKTRYADGADKAREVWAKLDVRKPEDVEKRLAFMEATHTLGMGHPDYAQTVDSILGEGTGQVTKNLGWEVYQDPLIGSPMSILDNYVPGVSKAVSKNKGASIEKVKVPLKTVVRSLRNPESRREIFKKMAIDPEYNPFDLMYNNLNRRLNNNTILGMIPEEGTVQKIEDLNDGGVNFYRVGPAYKVDPETKKVIVDPETNIPKTVTPKYRYRTADEFRINPYERNSYGMLKKYLKENYTEGDPEQKALQGFIESLRGAAEPPKFLDKVSDGAMYASLVNNLSTLFGNSLDGLKANVSNEALLEAGRLLQEDKALRKTLAGSSAVLSHKRTELGDTLTAANIPVGKTGVTIPDVTDRVQTLSKAHIWLSVMLDRINKAEGIDTDLVKKDLVSYLNAPNRKEAQQVLGKMLAYKVDPLDFMAQAMSESDRIAGRIIPQNQRPMFGNSAFRVFKIADSALKDTEQNAQSIMNVFRGDKNSIDNLKALGRTTLVKGSLFGMPGVVSGDIVDTVQSVLPEEQQVQLQEARNNKFGLVAAPLRAVGINTDRLVQPTVQLNPFINTGVPLVTDIMNVAGQGNALSEKGRVGQQLGSGVKLAMIGSRLLAPMNPAVGVLNALNPTATSRVAYEGLRTLGIAPDSEAPGVYKFGRNNTRTQNPISYVNAILGTSPDWEDKKLQTLIASLKNET